MGLLKYLYMPILKLFVYETKGFENIPKKGPAILVANHQSYVDGAFVLIFTDWYCKRWAHGIVLRRYIEQNWFRKLFYYKILEQIPTDGSVDKILKILSDGKLVMLFPEGGRTPNGKMQKATHTGLGVLASYDNIPVIPIGIRGSFDFWPRYKKWPSFKPRCISVRVGKPIKYTGKPNKKNHLAFQRKVMKAVAKLAKTKYPY